MKKITLFAGLLLFAASCTSVKEIGDLNMISTRNVDSQYKYELVKSRVNSSDRDLKRSDAKSVEEAVDDVLKDTPGGEHMRNVHIYLVKGKYYAVSGDVWGMAQADNQNFDGWKVGDHVEYMTPTGRKSGTIVELTDSDRCTVKLDESGKSDMVKYKNLKKN